MLGDMHPELLPQGDEGRIREVVGCRLSNALRNGVSLGALGNECGIYK